MKKILILSALFLLCSCSSKNSNKQQPEETYTTENVSVIDTIKSDVVSGATDIKVALMLNGTMVIPPQSNITMTLPISGIVSSFWLLPGNFVQKDDIIAILENTEFIDMQHNYLDAVAQIEYLEAEYNRQKTLSDNDVTSLKRLQQSKSEFTVAKNRKEAIGAKLSMLNISPKTLEKDGIIGKLIVKAPQSGYISDVMVNQGMFVDAGEPICQIINKTQILINLIAYEKDLNSVKVGEKIPFKANGLGDEIFYATITSIDQRVDPINRSVKVYAKVDTHNDNFRPGMYVIATIKK